MYNGQKWKDIVVKFEKVEFIGVKAIKTKNDQQNQHAYGHD